MSLSYLAGIDPPSAVAEKIYLLSDKSICLAASLDKGVYAHGEEIRVAVHVKNYSNKTVKRIKVSAFQQDLYLS